MCMTPSRELLATWSGLQREDGKGVSGLPLSLGKITVNSLKPAKLEA